MSISEAMGICKYGLLGEKLGHSLSPIIHNLLGNSEYELIEIAKDDLAQFLKGDWQGLNVTIPYKKEVIQYCKHLSEQAKKIGAVNVLYKNEKGEICGDNTDYNGLSKLISDAKVSFTNKKVLVLGSGGASATAICVSEDLGASEVVVISRKGENNYQNLSKHYDAQVIINTTPVGMYPNTQDEIITLDNFKQLEAVFDCIYNPLKTRLILSAEKKGIVAVGGLKMLTTQAYDTHCIFNLTAKMSNDELYKTMLNERENIVLIGMPGCGKSSIAKELARKLNKRFIDIDYEIKRESKMQISDIFANYGEKYFRELETSVIKNLHSLMGVVIACGGGSVLKQENIDYLKANGKLIYVKRDINLLATNDRPLSTDIEALEDMFKVRGAIYEKNCDLSVENNGELEVVLAQIEEMLK